MVETVVCFQMQVTIHANLSLAQKTLVYSAWNGMMQSSTKYGDTNLVTYLVRRLYIYCSLEIILNWHRLLLAQFLIYLQLKASSEKHGQDAFTLEMVSEDLLEKFNFVAGIVPVLSTHLSQVRNSQQEGPL